MNLSIVLWNCKGPGTQEDRIESTKKTHQRWRSKKSTPLVVLAQEVAKGMGEFWMDHFYSVYGHENPVYFDVSSQLLGNYVVNLEKIIDTLKLKYLELDRICPSILKVDNEKFLMCSWHGPSTMSDDLKKKTLTQMLKFVDKIKIKYNCYAALVGGDYNLAASKTQELLSDPDIQTPTGAKVYDYVKPSWRSELIDFIIAWPEERFSQPKCSVIEEIKDGTLFTHAPIRYDFTFTLPEQATPPTGQSTDDLSASMKKIEVK